MRRATRVEAHALAAVIRVAVRFLPLPQIVVFLARLPRARESVSGTWTYASAAEEAVRRMAHPTCLFTALVAFALLERRGYAPRFVIGAARDCGFDAHAWVNVDGVPVLPCAREYVPLWTYGAARSEAT